MPFAGLYKNWGIYIVENTNRHRSQLAARAYMTASCSVGKHGLIIVAKSCNLRCKRSVIWQHVQIFIAHPNDKNTVRTVQTQQTTQRTRIIEWQDFLLDPRFKYHHNKHTKSSWSQNKEKSKSIQTCCRQCSSHTKLYITGLELYCSYLWFT